MTMVRCQSARGESPYPKNLTVDNNSVCVRNPTIPSPDIGQLSTQLSTLTTITKISTPEEDRKAIISLLSKLAITVTKKTEPEYDYWLTVKGVDDKFITFSFTLEEPFPEGWKKGSSLMAKFSRLNNRAALLHVDKVETKNKKMLLNLSVFSLDLSRLKHRLLEGENLLVLLSLHSNERITNPLNFFDLNGRFNATTTHGFKILKMISNGLEFGSTDDDVNEKILAGVPKQFILTKDANQIVITLVNEQRKAIAMDASNELILNLDSGAGTGKTTTIAASICHRIKDQRDVAQLIFVVTETNSACEQVVHALLKCSEYLDRVRPMRLVSLTNDSATPTEVDVCEILDKYVYNNEEVADKQKLLEQFHELYTLSKKERTNRQKYMHEAEIAAKKLVGLAYDVYRPNVIFATQSTLLNKLKSKKSELAIYYNDDQRRQVTIWVDEASMMPAKIIPALASLFPFAFHRYVGDPKQLQPYQPIRIGKRTILGVSDLLDQSGLVPRCELRGCRRMHPELTKMSSELFYGGKLTSAVKERERSTILNKIDFPNDNIPFSFINVEGKCQEDGKSRLNREEADKAVALANLLQKIGTEPKQICIICFYLAQKTFIENMNLPYSIMTADSVQGKEYDAVIILTTRTFGDPRFICKLNRVTVAMTRSCEALFVLGKASYLEKLSIWGDIITYAKERNMILDDPPNYTSLLVKC